jgi:hypothetical protein
MRQHTSAYVSIRQHTSACVSIRQHASAYVSMRSHAFAYVSMRQHTSASAYGSVRQHTSAFTLVQHLYLPPHNITSSKGCSNQYTYYEIHAILSHSLSSPLSHSLSRTRERSFSRARSLSHELSLLPSELEKSPGAGEAAYQASVHRVEDTEEEPGDRAAPPTHQKKKISEF